jgi:2-keto-4-pentenoate hydratase/2-oxohepta-3-ene-1,7-dioic acid hydratase in catechol pathway
MRIARDRQGGLLLGSGDGGWVRASSLGGPATDLADLLPELDRLSRAAADATAEVVDPVLGPPVDRPGKILAVGLNYLGHIAELGKPRPDAPMIFAKYPSALTGPRGVVELDPRVTAELDYEVELAVVIGPPARRVSATDALDHVLGYCVANDVSARDVQRAESQISRSKGMDTFCPLGPWITTADEVGDPRDLRIRSWVGDELRQDSTTADLLFDVPTLVAHLSRTTTLETGDVILTGTPSGVGSGMKPPGYLKEGDVVRCEIERLGTLENRVVVPEVAR